MRIAKKGKEDRTKPDPSCNHCKGKGMYPPEEQGGKQVMIYTGSSKGAKPCPQCWDAMERSGNDHAQLHSA